MGSWFANVSVRKNGIIQPKDIMKRITEMMAERQYAPASPEEAIVSFAVLTQPESPWYSVYSDAMEPGNTADGWAARLSAELGTEALEIGCLDSDYLYLNLIDAVEKLDAWAGVGSAAGMGIKRRTNLSAWRPKVEDFPRFQEGIRKKRIFAEDALYDILPCLGLPAELGAASYDNLEEFGLDEGAERLYFRLLDCGEPTEPVKFALNSASFWGDLDEPGVVGDVAVVNVGGASRGLSVYFIAPWFEHGEVSLTDVKLVTGFGSNEEVTPIELKRVKFKDGRWGMAYHDPCLRIPARVPDRFPLRKQMDERFRRAIRVRYTPCGELDKVLDIIVCMVPDENPMKGQLGWFPWYNSESKEEYIAEKRKGEEERRLIESLRAKENRTDS